MQSGTLSPRLLLFLSLGMELGHAWQSGYLSVKKTQSFLISSSLPPPHSFSVLSLYTTSCQLYWLLEWHIHKTHITTQLRKLSHTHTHTHLHSFACMYTFTHPSYWLTFTRSHKYIVWWVHDSPRTPWTRVAIIKQWQRMNCCYSVLFFLILMSKTGGYTRNKT